MVIIHMQHVFCIACNEYVSNATIHWTADMLQRQSLCNSVHLPGIKNTRHVSLLATVHTSQSFIYQWREKTHAHRLQVKNVLTKQIILHSPAEGFDCTDGDTTLKTDTTMDSCCHKLTVASTKQQDRNMFWYNHKTNAHSLRWGWLSAINWGNNASLHVAEWPRFTVFFICSMILSDTRYRCIVVD
jgi:hypothetical protein